jgi:hypothetical protein
LQKNSSEVCLCLRATPNHSLEILCSTFGMSTSGYYEWLSYARPQ